MKEHEWMKKISSRLLREYLRGRRIRRVNVQKLEVGIVSKRMVGLTVLNGAEEYDRFCIHWDSSR